MKKKFKIKKIQKHFLTQKNKRSLSFHRLKHLISCWRGKKSTSILNYVFRLYYEAQLN
jgi:hypothetical protein